MILTQSSGAIGDSLFTLWYQVGGFMPNILAAFVVFLIGWIVATILYRLVLEITKAIRLDEALKSAGVQDAAKDAGVTIHAGRFLATLIMWFVMIVFLVASLEILGLVAVTVFLTRVVLQFLPQVIMASLILIIGAIVAEAAKKLVSGSAKAAGAYAGNMAGALAKYAIWIFTIFAALIQIDIAPAFIQSLFVGIVFALSLAFGLAFGLGGRDAAAETIKRIKEEIKHDF